MEKKSTSKPVVMISFSEGGENGGPYNSHKRIVESSLKEKYDFIPLLIPKGRIGIFNIGLLVKLRKDMLKINPDIVHFSGLQLLGFHVVLACKLAGINTTLLAIRGSSMEAVNFSFWKKKIVSILEVLTLKMSYACYGVSEYVCGWERVKKYSNRCYGHIYNIPKDYKQINAVNSSLSIREEIGAKYDDILIVSTGRITREKGFEVLLKVIETMTIPDQVKFVIVGDGEFLPIMKKKVKNLKLESYVIFLGYRNDIIRILSDCDVFVLPSLHETLCNSVLEAGFSSLPSVVSNVGGVPEIIEHNYNGFLVESRNIQEFIKFLNILIFNEKKRALMGQNAKKLVDMKFDEKIIVRQIDELYEVLLKGSYEK